MRHDLGDMLHLVPAVLHEFLPDPVAGHEGFLIPVFESVGDGELVALVENPGDIEFRHAVLAQPGGMLAI